ncbi:MAG: sensor histidine kinase [Chloroflexi bacterium]|nr:sensor histidine kinase [Chloroflexota bacterium]
MISARKGIKEPNRRAVEVRRRVSPDLMEVELSRMEEALRTMSLELSLAEEHERRRIAVALHERVTQNLALCRIKLGEVTRSVPSVAREIGEVQEVLKGLIKETRSLTFELSPPHLYEIGLEVALEELTDQVRERHNLPVTFKDDGRAKPVDDEVRVLLFQMVRELLVNVMKHAKARHCSVVVESVKGNLQITVEDDGVGFDQSVIRSDGRRSKGFGLFSIRERLSYIGGRFQINSKPGYGTRATLTVPLKSEGGEVPV